MLISDKKFYDVLERVFVGADYNGKKENGIGGFIRLSRIKKNYYRKIREHLEDDIADSLKGQSQKFRQEFYDKLSSFFSRYFTSNGSICFNKASFHGRIYERVYEDDQDVSLFWKTQMLHYVKTERIYEDMAISVGNFDFRFSCEHLENKITNEKQNIMFEFDSIDENKDIIFQVKKSGNGNKTDNRSIIKQLKELGISNMREVYLDKAFRLFERQVESDFFINKQSKEFLEEQFNLWLYQYFWTGASEWPTERVNQLHIIKKIAFKVIAFIAQFEDELLRIWNKPKFVMNSNYVITMDRLSKILRAKIKKSKGYKQQTKEWKELGIDEKNPKAPLDTKFFKELELEIIAEFDDLDNSLDGWLIKSENYQALNTILPKFKNKVQCIYIDPPFNTGSDFTYMDRFQDSTWLTLMQERIELGRQLLKDSGNFYLHLDNNANHYGRVILDNIFDEDNFRNEIIWWYSWGIHTHTIWNKKHDTILYYCKNQKKVYFDGNKARVPYREGSGMTTDPRWNKKYSEEGKLPEDVFDITDFNVNIPGFISYQELISLANDGVTTIDILSLISNLELPEDIFDIATINARSKERIGYPTQKPVELIERILKASSNEGDLIADFFCGSGTSLLAANKLGRKWLGVEMDDDAWSCIMSRYKKYLADPQSVLDKKNGNGDLEGGGFFKYYELEQYEAVLREAKYADLEGSLFTQGDKSVYEQYVFLPDEKLLAAIESDTKSGAFKVNPDNLYKNKPEVKIDIAETISNLTGKNIRRITKDNKLILYDKDGGEEEFDLNNLDIETMKSLIWWESKDL